VVSLINNASAVNSYFVLNSRHNMHTIFLGFKVVYI